MNDLISRQAAIKEIKKCRFVVDAYERIKVLPSAQPEIVWCKDCENYYTEEDDDDQYGYCRNHEFWTSGIWFCADGERRKNGRI